MESDWENYEKYGGSNYGEKQVNSNISLDSIYNAIWYLNPEQQGIILNHYKITELYSILADDESYKKYIDDLFAVSDGYMKRAIALSVLHTEAFLQSMGKQRFDVLDSMGKAYDNLPDIDKKIFCENMLQKKEFFQDAYKMMMNSFQNAKEIKKGKVVENGEVSKKVER